MSEVGPGRHPKFKITNFSVNHQRCLRRMELLFHLTRDGNIKIGSTSNYQYALIKPTSFVKSFLHTDREILVVFSSYPDFQPRTIDAFDKVLEDLADFRIEKVVRILISDDPKGHKAYYFNVGVVESGECSECKPTERSAQMAL